MHVCFLCNAISTNPDMEKCYYIQTNLYYQVKDHKTLTKNYNEPNVTRDVQDRERDRLREVASKNRCMEAISVGISHTILKVYLLLIITISLG